MNSFTDLKAWKKFSRVIIFIAICSITSVVWAGTIIGPDGGEVLSSDGKARLIIPAGALSTSQDIEVLPVSSETLQNTIPTNTALLNAVECKPYGLEFNSAVSLVYTLNNAEIPGTPVELGLYDSVQNKVNPTGQTSVISADGYSVTFSLQHFSTYAALMSLVSQGSPIGGGVKIPLPDILTGAFGHAVSITVPPGRKGMQPGLGLSYRSSGGSSWLGQGFSLNPGYIVRSTRLGPPSYIDTQDTFYLITDAGTTELVHLIDNLYQAKIESEFNRFYKEADGSWRVVSKAGGILRFGQTDGAREAGSGGTFAWYLTKASDTNGNYMTYEYVKDEGKVYLNKINYTGNDDVSIAPKNSVEFVLETRPDITSSYMSGVKIATTKRLKEILVKADNQLAWRYVLGYAQSSDTSRSMLTSVTQYTADGFALPAQQFTYQENE